MGWSYWVNSVSPCQWFYVANTVSPTYDTCTVTVPNRSHTFNTNVIPRHAAAAKFYMKTFYVHGGAVCASRIESLREF